MIKVQIHSDPSGTSTWKPPACSVCDKLVGPIYFVKATGVLCSACEGKLRKKKQKRKKK